MTRGHDRGQLLLITAIMLAIVLLMLAVMLNVTILADALAADGSTADAERDIVGYLDGVDRGITTIIVANNERRNSTIPYEVVVAETRTSVHSWSDQAAASYLRDGTYTNVTVDEVDVRTRIVHDNASATFTDADGAANWQVFADAPGIDVFELNISRDDLVERNASCSPDEGCFELIIQDVDGATSRVYVANRSGEITLEASTPAGTTTCSTPAAVGKIDLVNGTLDGDVCDRLDIVDQHTAPMELRYANATNASGTYVIDIEGQVTSTGAFHTEGSPRKIPLVSAVNLSVTYRSPSLEYHGAKTITVGDGDG